MQSRLTELNDSNITPEQRRVLDQIMSGPRGNLDGPFLAWVHSPALADQAQQLGAFCRYHTQLPLRLSELAILVTAQWWQSQAEWEIHAPIAIAAGLDNEQVERLRLGLTPVFADPAETLVYRLGHELYSHKRINATLYREAVEQFGEVTLVELIGIFGYYALVAMTLNAFAVDRQSGAEPPFAEPD